MLVMVDFSKDPPLLSHVLVPRIRHQRSGSPQLPRHKMAQAPELLTQMSGHDVYISE